MSGSVERLTAWADYLASKGNPNPYRKNHPQAAAIERDLRFALSRIASLETALKERTAELKIATGALQADGRFAETVKVLTDVLDEYDSEEG